MTEGAFVMQQFINLSIKAITENIAEIPDALFGSKRQRQNEVTTQSESYGGFTTNDWEKIGIDMKRSIINLGKKK